MSNQLSTGTNNASVPSRNSPAELSTPQHAPFTTTPDVLLNHPMTIRSFILHDILLDKPIEKSFFELSGIFGSSRLSYSDFMYWYNKFSRGNFGMEDERRPEFSTLPVHIIERIVEKLELKEIMILRNVSKSLRNFVDQRDEFPCKSIEIGCDSNYIRCQFNKEEVIYASTSWRMPIDYDHYEYGHAKVMRSVDYQKIACDQLRYVLMKPKLQLNRLYIRCEYGSVEFSELECFETLFNSIGRMIVAKKVIIEVHGPAMTINVLSILDPVTLSCIELNCFKRPDGSEYDYEIWSTEKINQLTSLDQWKQASELIAKDPFDFCEPEHFSQFGSLRFTFDIIDREKILKLRNVSKNMFSNPRSSLTSCSVQTESKFDRSVLSSRNGFVLQRHRSFADDVTLHYDFPNVDGCYLEVHYYPKHDEITIQKLWR
ncbi:hypothetical protein CRE_30212 [Caenorhabditis remanei]|uniref:F-box domain-containing protein n=1 Tax=Caenorhabditis remanei TaxID=31234 RepID=E3NGM6_CAERE|nr:hypothetical protein CRE_30212 [Caenorhabditis remanei]